MEVKAPKRIKTQEQEEDRISLLSDRLIIEEILPRLESTKSAIRTGALSKRWRHLWPLVPSLHFTDYSFKKLHPFFISKPLPEFYTSVDKTLDQCKFKNLKKFSVSANYCFYFESDVDKWIQFVISCKVQNFHMDLNYKHFTDQFVFEDESFFINSHFTHLHLEHCLFYPTGPISWNNLTHLTISYARLDHDLIEDILSGSPVLDTLRLVDCYGYLWINVTSKSVKNLVFHGYNNLDDKSDNLEDVIEINAPYIKSLKICGYLLLWKLVLRDVSSLVKAELDYTKMGYNEMTSKVEREEMLKRFILRLHHVKELKIGIDCYTVFSRLEAKGFIFPSSLKVVKVDYPIYDTDSTELGDSSDSDSSVGDTAVDSEEDILLDDWSWRGRG
uniref:putative F-box protein At1g49610 n=1 Tax=Erigeron canadensis TaxID=72917 RepID=UPI001CB9C5C3|nr:putative F-box protein At1g49610 [Erigeron canadensis]